MSAKQQAIKDIKDELRQNSQCFIAFRSELNPIMKELVSNYINLQKTKV